MLLKVLNNESLELQFTFQRADFLLNYFWSERMIKVLVFIFLMISIPIYDG